MILRFYDVSTGPTQPWCSTSQEQQPAGSRHPESRSLEVTMPRPMAVRCCAVSSQGLAATLSCAAGFALCDAHCGCSGGVGSMVRVWGAMAPARFVLFLLLMAMCFRETCAAPWRAPGAEPRPTAQRKRQACFPPVLQCDLPVHWRPPSKKAPRSCIFFHAVREGCGTWPGESIVYAARCQPTGHPGHSATLGIVT